MNPESRRRVIRCSSSAGSDHRGHRESVFNHSFGRELLITAAARERERENRAYFADSLQNLFTADRYCLRTALFLLAEVSQIMRTESIPDKCVERFSVSSDAAVWIFNPVLRNVFSADAEGLSARSWSRCSVNLNE